MYRGAGIILYRFVDGEAEVLLGERSHNPDKGYWSLPAGGMEPVDGKDFLLCAVRETNEEYFGYTALANKYLTEKILDKEFTTFFIPFLFHFKTFFLPVDEHLPPLVKNREFVQVKWFRLNNLPRKVHPGVKQSIKKKRKLLVQQ